MQTFTTATASCTADRTAITNAQRAVSQQELTVAAAAAVGRDRAGAVDSAVDAPRSRRTRRRSRRTRSPSHGAKARARDRASLADQRHDDRGQRERRRHGRQQLQRNSSSSSSTGGSGQGGGGGGANTTSSSVLRLVVGLVDIENLKKLEVVAGFAEADATKIKVGQPATVTLAALTEHTVAGKVTAVSPTSTVTSNVVTYDVTISSSTRRRACATGMTADVSRDRREQDERAAVSQRRDHHDRSQLDRDGPRERQADVTTGDDRARRRVDDARS